MVMNTKAGMIKWTRKPHKRNTIVQMNCTFFCGEGENMNREMVKALLKAMVKASERLWSWYSYHSEASVEEHLTQTLCPAGKEGTQLTYPGEAKRNATESIQDTEQTASNCLRSNITVTWNHWVDKSMFNICFLSLGDLGTIIVLTNPSDTRLNQILIIMLWHRKLKIYYFNSTNRSFKD